MVQLLSGLRPLMLSGTEVHPMIEGGKGIGVSSGISAGAFAAAGGVGTFSAVNAESYDAHGNPISYVYQGTTRRERHEELIALSIEGGITQARIAHDIAGGNGRIHANILWEMGGAERVIHGILEGSKGLIHGITCGAGMPYRVAEIAEHYGVYYYPIISSMRAFRALWKRAYHKRPQWLGGVVYEDPWLAGGHNGLSNSEDPLVPQDPYPRVAELRRFMNEEAGLSHVPVVMAGGVWNVAEWSHWLDNPEIGPVAFQLGTRPIVTQESPVPLAWKQRLVNLREGDVFLNRFSPTGFYSSAVRNGFIDELEARNQRQIAFRTTPDTVYTTVLLIGPRRRPVYLTPEGHAKALTWEAEGYSTPMRTPDETLIFVTDAQSRQIVQDQIDCMGCLSACRFSNWSDHMEGYTTGQKADPRSYCIQKTLQAIVTTGDVDHQLMFSGHNAYRFGTDPLYAGGYIPTVAELIQALLEGR